MPQKRKFTDQQFLELYNKKLNDSQIAKMLNVSRQSIARKRFRLGLMPTNPRSYSNPALSHEKLKLIDKKQNKKPERLVAKKAYHKEYQKRPEVKARMKAQDQTPERKAKIKAARLKRRQTTNM